MKEPIPDMLIKLYWYEDEDTGELHYDWDEIASEIDRVAWKRLDADISCGICELEPRGQLHSPIKLDNHRRNK